MHYSESYFSITKDKGNQVDLCFDIPPCVVSEPLPAEEEVAYELDPKKNVIEECDSPVTGVTNNQNKCKLIGEDIEWMKPAKACCPRNLNCNILNCHVIEKPEDNEKSMVSTNGIHSRNFRIFNIVQGCRSGGHIPSQ